MNEGQPNDPNGMALHERRALLATAYAHGQAISQLALVGDNMAAIEAYVGRQQELTVSQAPAGILLTFDDCVWWEITVGAGGTILGTSQSGYTPLMEKLGIDFSGAPYVAGN
ncbi:hypothetical protein [Parerythrobacter lacustris]|uniref:Uncharacterized protein n=1 Tax=Parerythrobacter lacustris TaxID=2969984 RepID=A0ABT1XXU9_9SPHN|nr:hypothetical protein [Parerythrobacter lacustris]MCR2835277.1 hypothetical protein [Parerythrobacter lacustris]